MVLVMTSVMGAYVQTAHLVGIAPQVLILKNLVEGIDATFD